MRYLNSYILCLLALLLCTGLSAQAPEVKWGSESRFQKRIRISGMLSDESENFYVVKQSTRRGSTLFIIERYSGQTVSSEQTAEFELPFIQNQQSVFEDILLLGGRLWLFCSIYHSETRTQQVYGLAISAGLSYEGDPVEIARIPAPSSRKMPGFQLVESDDQRLLLVVHSAPFERYNDEKFSYRVYDSGMNLRWAKELEFPYKDKYFKISNYLLDRHGNIFMLSSIATERRKGQEGRNSVPNNLYVLLAYYPFENKLKEFEVNLGDKWVSALTFEMAPNGDLVVGGFYSHSQQYSIAGTFYMRIDPQTREVKSKNLKAFEPNFMREFLPERKVKKGLELSDFYFDHFVVREDGSALFVAEQYYMVVVYSYSDPFGYGPYGYPWSYSPYYSSPANYNYQYYYNDLIVVSVNSEGAIEWTKKIPKRQMSTNDGGYYSSYALGHYEGNVYILFNDHSRNTPEQRQAGARISSMNKPSKAVATLVSLDRQGGLTYRPLFSSRDIGLILRPKLNYQPSASKLVIFSQRGKRYKFGQLDLSGQKP